MYVCAHVCISFSVILRHKVEYEECLLVKLVLACVILRLQFSSCGAHVLLIALGIKPFILTEK